MKVLILRALEITGKGVASLWALAGLSMAQDRVGTETLGGGSHGLGWAVCSQGALGWRPLTLPLFVKY